MIQKYRMKPIVIEALEFKEGVTKEQLDNFIKCDKTIVCIIGTNIPCFVYINTLDGDMEGKWGDYIVKNINSEFCIAKKDLFDITFEKYNPYDTSGGCGCGRMGCTGRH